MDKFLEKSPEFRNQAELISQIKKKVVFKEIPVLDSYLSILKVPLFRKLIEKDFYSSKQLKDTYAKIIKEETNETEKMIFQMLCNREIRFSDIKLKFLFYKEFPGYMHLFASDGANEIEDLLFKKIYFKSSVDDKIQKIIEKSKFKSQIFYIISLHSHLDQNFIKNRLLELKNSQEDIKTSEGISEPDFIKYWVLALRCLSSRDFYTLSASELLYSSYLDKINFYRGVQEYANPEKLSIFMIRACFANSLSVVKTYIVFLKVIELFNLKYDFKLKLLYSWLRFFIIETHYDLFEDLMKNLKKSKKLDQEFEIYVAVEQCLIGSLNIGDLHTTMCNFEDQNDISDISLEKVYKSIEKQRNQQPEP